MPLAQTLVASEMVAKWFGDARFLEAFVKSVGVIGASEIGDKTFFIAAIMAMKNPRLTVRPKLSC